LVYCDECRNTERMRKRAMAEARAASAAATGGAS
jgi:hypothetical protein